MASDAGLKNCQEFTLFPKLPAEIQAMIWKYSVRGQNRVITARFNKDTQTLAITHAPVPAVFLVNRASYEATKKFYGVVRLGKIYPKLSYVYGTLHLEDRGPVVSVEHDIFRIKLPAVMIQTVAAGAIEKFQRAWDQKVDLVMLQQKLWYTKAFKTLMVTFGAKRFALGPSRFDRVSTAAGETGSLRMITWAFGADELFLAHNLVEPCCTRRDVTPITAIWYKIYQRHQTWTGSLKIMRGLLDSGRFEESQEIETLAKLDLDHSLAVEGDDWVTDYPGDSDYDSDDLRFDKMARKRINKYYLEFRKDLKDPHSEALEAKASVLNQAISDAAANAATAESSSDSDPDYIDESDSEEDPEEDSKEELGED
ncbi:hypothetical protein F5B20DRAFT_474687 [Whalleya microplaca]|nr:hypothetical protein F5B20DRAFT_474687 [Whalleya microplaca]